MCLPGINGLPNSDYWSAKLRFGRNASEANSQLVNSECFSPLTGLPNSDLAETPPRLEVNKLVLNAFLSHLIEDYYDLDNCAHP